MNRTRVTLKLEQLPTLVSSIEIDLKIIYLRFNINQSKAMDCIKKI